ncbi:MAG: GNAT family N-acetyltransferase [Pseudomonadota bacterium]
MGAPVITVRRGTEADIGAVDALLQRSYPRQLKADYPPSIMVTAVPILARANPGLVSSGTYYVAVTDEGDVVGAGGWSRSIKRAGTADVRHLVTDDRHTRRGIGRRVMMGIVSEARLAGANRLDCLATRTAQPFYEAMGFTVLGEMTIGLRPGIEFPVIRMQRKFA